MRNYSYIFLYLFFFVSFVSISAFEEPVYQLKEIIKDSDIDDSFVEEIDSVTPPYPEGSSFQIGDLKYKKGKFTVYKFMNVDWGEVSTSSKKVLVHKILVLKVDEKNIIQSGYRFTLEWQDVPSYNIYRVKAKKKLKKGLLIKDLKMELLQKEQTPESPSGILDNVLGAKFAF